MGKTAQKIHSSTQKFTEVHDIVDDIVIFSNNTAALVIEVTSTNFTLLSQEEQNTKIYSYAALLNSLSFPIQILIRSQKLDISSYLKLLDQQATSSTNQMLATQIRLYRDFVQQLVQVNTVLDKSFYIVLSYNSLEKGVGAASQKTSKNAQENFVEDARKILHSKAESLRSQLGRLTLPSKILPKEELVKLFYEIFNGTFTATNEIADNMQTEVITTHV